MFCKLSIHVYSAFPSKPVVKNTIKMNREIYLKNVLNAIQSITKQKDEKVKSVHEQKNYKCSNCSKRS